MQTWSKAGKINIPNYRDKRPKKTNNTKNKVSNDSLEVWQKNENEPGEIVSNHKEIENSHPEINFENENETLEQYNEKLLDNHQNNSMINNEINAHMNDQSQIADQISEKENILSNARTNYNCGKLFVECKEQLFMRKDNYIYFITTEGTDKGSLQLSERKELPRFSHLNPGEIKITNKNHKLHFVLVIRGEIPVSTTEVMNNITTALKVLKSIIIKENLCSINIAKSDNIENVLWKEITIKMRNILKGLSLKIIICNGLIKYVQKIARK